METIRVLIVDDSATMRRLIRAGLEQDPQIRVVAEAATAREARDAVKSMELDVMTLDVEMPGMDGIEFLERLMRGRPMPVVMISSLTAKGSDAAIRALALGAVECIEKPRFGAARETFAYAVETIKMAATAKVRARSQQAAAHGAARVARAPMGQRFPWNGKTVLIGSSTGGVEALETVLADFPIDCPPTVITQHMPASFLASFAARLNGSVAPNVRIAMEGERIQQGDVVIAPGEETHLHLSGADGHILRLHHGPKTSGHRPSVDEMMISALPNAKHVVAAILTGMGRDGAQGMKLLRDAGAYCIGQDEQSSVVYGMPRIAMEWGGVHEQQPLKHIAKAILAKASKEAVKGGQSVAS